MIFFTADLHFSHHNIIKYCNRPFDSVEDMDLALVNNWNSLVKDKDEVYILGDFAFNNGVHFAKKLNGTKYLIRGNHDHNKDIRAYTEAKIFKWIKSYHELKYNKTKIVLFHYALRTWNCSHHGSYHLYAHSHGTLPGIGKSLDVGVDCWAYYPVSIDRVIMTLATRPTDLV